jgi:putative redox protein
MQILAKQRLTPASYDIDVRGERGETPPSPYTRIVVTHRLRGAGLTRHQVERVVELVEERYCSVAATLPRGLTEHRVEVVEAS